MTPRIDIISSDVNASLADVIHLITTKGHSRIPVFEDNLDNVTGFMYAKDLLNVDMQNTSLIRHCEKSCIYSRNNPY